MARLVRVVASQGKAGVPVAVSLGAQNMVTYMLRDFLLKRLDILVRVLRRRLLVDLEGSLVVARV